MTSPGFTAPTCRNATLHYIKIQSCEAQRGRGQRQKAVVGLTPAGVPVITKSPACRVITLLAYRSILSMGWIMCPARLRCRSSPFTFSHISNSCQGVSFGHSKGSTTGRNVSKPLATLHGLMGNAAHTHEKFHGLTPRIA